MKLCNCANCGEELSSKPVKDVKALAGHIKGRPYCDKCLVSFYGVGGRSGVYKGEPSPGWENAVRCMEDGRN